MIWWLLALAAVAGYTVGLWHMARFTDRLARRYDEMHDTLKREFRK